LKKNATNDTRNEGAGIHSFSFLFFLFLFFLFCFFFFFVIPAQAGIHFFSFFPWIPAFAGMTKKTKQKKHGRDAHATEKPILNTDS